MKIYKNPWVTRESYFVKTGAAKSAKMEAAKSSGYSIDFWDGKWVVRKTAYYNKSLSEMPVVCENRCSLQTRIDKAIVDTVLGFVEVARERTAAMQKGDTIRARFMTLPSEYPGSGANDEKRFPVRKGTVV